MGREPQIPAAMMAAFVGLQGSEGVAPAFVVARVMYALEPWREPTPRELAKAQSTAERFRLAEDLAVFLPPEPGRCASRSRKGEFKGVVIALKRIDELEGDERAEAIAQVRGLLGAG